jgi:KUP system potassium uptake protein
MRKGIDRPSHPPHGSFATLMIGALGIVYGDIGTSPLYAMYSCSPAETVVCGRPADILGGVSLVIWIITIVVTIKYAISVLRAQSDGQGGLRALWRSA